MPEVVTAPNLMASFDDLVNEKCYSVGKSKTASALKEIDLLAKIFAGGSSVPTWSQGFAPPHPCGGKILDSLTVSEQLDCPPSGLTSRYPADFRVLARERVETAWQRGPAPRRWRMVDGV
ncbi:hypothetical protein [Massilia sp. DWR3-1-1]|uniref:hypothetical protein n=1 Tax=Massilia sp. DWR3-1-1 TaxID=2804559 RepID=UPI003CFB4449